MPPIILPIRRVEPAMKLQLSQDELSRLLPTEPALTAHCRRVAALAMEIAPAMMIPPRYRVVLEQAAMLHHKPAVSLDSDSLRKVIADVIPQEAARKSNACRASRSLPEDIEAVLRAMRGRVRSEPDHRIRKIVEILILSDLLDEQLEFLSLEPGGSIWDRL